MGKTIPFQTLFQFESDDDFLASLLPGYRQQPDSFVEEVRLVLSQHRTEAGIILDAERRLNLLWRSETRGHE